MSTKHTPGPWRLRELNNSTLAVYGSGEYDIVFPKRNAPRDADARLIAAAPELLEALEEIMKCEAAFSTDQLTFANNVIKKHVEIAQAAIAKAKGELE